MLQAAEPSRRPTRFWWSAAPPDTSRPWSPNLRAKYLRRKANSALAAKARAALAELGLAKVTVQVAAATDGDRAHAPYDVIVLNGATEIFPEGLCRQLREGGRLVGVFAATQPPRATLVTHSHEDFGSRPLFDAVAPVLPGLERRPVFVF